MIFKFLKNLFNQKNAPEEHDELDEYLSEFKTYIDSAELVKDETLGTLSAEGSSRIQRKLLEEKENE